MHVYYYNNTTLIFYNINMKGNSPFSLSLSILFFFGYNIFRNIVRYLFYNRKFVLVYANNREMEKINLIVYEVRYMSHGVCIVTYIICYCTATGQIQKYVSYSTKKINFKHFNILKLVQKYHYRNW